MFNRTIYHSGKLSRIDQKSQSFASEIACVCCQPLPVHFSDQGSGVRHSSKPDSRMSYCVKNFKGHTFCGWRKFAFKFLGDQKIIMLD